MNTFKAKVNKIKKDLETYILNYKQNKDSKNIENINKELNDLIEDVPIDVSLYGESEKLKSFRGQIDYGNKEWITSNKTDTPKFDEVLKNGLAVVLLGSEPTKEQVTFLKDLYINSAKFIIVGDKTEYKDKGAVWDKLNKIKPINIPINGIYLFGFKNPDVELTKEVCNRM